MFEQVKKTCPLCGKPFEFFRIKNIPDMQHCRKCALEMEVLK